MGRSALNLRWMALLAAALACGCTVEEVGTPGADLGSTGGDVGPTGGAMADAGPSGGVHTDALVDVGTLPELAPVVDLAVPAPDLPIGAATGATCVEGEECASQFCLTSMFAQAISGDPDVEIPGGYCARLGCANTEECLDENASCIDLKASGLDVQIYGCLQTCAPDAGDCRADHLCHCDPTITDTMGNHDICLCLPPVLIELLSGG